MMNREKKKSQWGMEGKERHRALYIVGPLDRKSDWQAAILSVSLPVPATGFPLSLSIYHVLYIISFLA